MTRTIARSYGSCMADLQQVLFLQNRSQLLPNPIVYIAKTGSDIISDMVHYVGPNNNI